MKNIEPESTGGTGTSTCFGDIDNPTLLLPTPPSSLLITQQPKDIYNQNSETYRFSGEVKSSPSPPSMTTAITFPPPPTPVNCVNELPSFSSSFHNHHQVILSPPLQSLPSSSSASPFFPPPPSSSTLYASSYITHHRHSNDVQVFDFASRITKNSELSQMDVPMSRYMFHSIDLSSLWPSIDFSRLFQPFQPPPVNESDLDEDVFNENDNKRERKKRRRKGEGEEKEEEALMDDPELVSIEQNRERQLALEWQLSQVIAEQSRLQIEMERNESIVGAMVQARLAAITRVTTINAADRRKLELLINDMIMIIRLMASIVQQLARNKIQQQQRQHEQKSKVLFSTTTKKKTKENINRTLICCRSNNDKNIINGCMTTTTNANGIINNHDGDGDEAVSTANTANHHHHHYHHNNHEIHCSADTVGDVEDLETLVSAVAAKVVEDENEILVKEAKVEEQQQQKRLRLLAQLEEAKQLRNNIETRRTMLEQRLTRKCNDAVASSVRNGNITDNSNGQVYTTTINGLFLWDNIDLTTLICYYLDAKEHLLVQQEVGKLLHEDLKWRIEDHQTTIIMNKTNTTITGTTATTIETISDK